MKIRRSTAIACLGAFVLGVYEPLMSILSGDFDSGVVVAKLFVAAILTGLVGATKELLIREVPTDEAK